MISGTRTLFEWSLRSDTKAFAPHVTRAVFAGFILLSVMAAWSDSFGTLAPGLGFFNWICNLNILVISVAGISYFVSAVTEEKDSGTLSLLQLAGVSPLAIVLSKSTSRFIGALMLLLIQMPFTFLAVTLGGVTWQQIVASYLALGGYLWMVSNVALFCSVFCSTSGRAASLSTFLLLLFYASAPILTAFAGLKNVSWVSQDVVESCEKLVEQQQQISVVPRIAQILDPTSSITYGSTQLWMNLLIGAVAFLLSIVSFRFFTERVDPTGGSTSKARRISNGRCWKHSIAWKDFLFFTGGRSFLVVRILAYAGLIGGFMWYHTLIDPRSSEWMSSDLNRIAFSVVSLFFTVEILLYSSNSLFQEVRQTTISSLKMLPASTPSILWQKLIAAMLALLPAVATLLFLFFSDYYSYVNADTFVSGAVSWVFFALMSTHLTVLLSLYTRWAALPLAILITVVSTPCVGGAAAGLTLVTRETAALNGISAGIWLAVAVNLVWMWLFILLPMEIEIVNRWNRLSRE